MSRLLTICVFALVSACASGAVKNPPSIIAPKCQDTPVKVQDLAKFGLQPTKGKIVVARLMRINCPYCKEDLLHMAALFQQGIWTTKDVQILLIAYRKEGVEDRKTFDTFMREELPSLGIPMEAVQAVYLDKDYYGLVKMKNARNEQIFETWRAVPFGLVFGRDGRLAYRGHFTTSTGSEDEHYKFVTELQKEDCQKVPGT